MNTIAELLDIGKIEKYGWSVVKNEQLKQERAISFEEVVSHIADGWLVWIEDKPGDPSERKLLVLMYNVVYVVPAKVSPGSMFMLTAYPSRKATQSYCPGYAA